MDTTKIDSLDRLTNEFSKLPGVGKKTAARYACYIVTGSKEQALGFADAIISAKEKIKFCSNCGNFADGDLCGICKTRNESQICVVKEPKDIMAIEKAHSYSGSYHVLHGTINPLANIAPKDIKSKLYTMDSADVARYAIQDAVLTLKVWKVLEPMLHAEGLWPVFELETELSPVLIKMREKGVRINAEKRDQLIEELTKREATAKEAIKEICGREVDVWSAKDIADAYIQQGHNFYYTKASVKKAARCFRLN